MCQVLFQELQVSRFVGCIVFSLKERKEWDPSQDTVRNTVIKIYTQHGGGPGMRMTYCVVRDHSKGEVLTESWKMCKSSLGRQDGKGHSRQKEEHIKIHRQVQTLRDLYIILFRWSSVGGLKGHKTGNTSGVYIMKNLFYIMLNEYLRGVKLLKDFKQKCDVLIILCYEENSGDMGDIQRKLHWDWRERETVTILEGRVTVVTTVVQPQFRVSPVSEMLKDCLKANALGKKREGLLWEIFRKTWKLVGYEEWKRWLLFLGCKLNMA